jgi:hypothetical protein
LVSWDGVKNLEKTSKAQKKTAMEIPLKTTIASPCLGKDKVLYRAWNDVRAIHCTAPEKEEYRISAPFQLLPATWGPNIGPLVFGDIPLQPW